MVVVRPAWEAVGEMLKPENHHMIAIYAGLLGTPLVVLVVDMLLTLSKRTEARQNGARQVPTRLSSD